MARMSQPTWQAAMGGLIWYGQGALQADRAIQDLGCPSFDLVLPQAAGPVRQSTICRGRWPGRPRASVSTLIARRAEHLGVIGAETGSRRARRMASCTGLTNDAPAGELAADLR